MQTVSPGTIDAVRSSYSKLFENEIGFFWDYGYCVPLVRLCLWSIQIAHLTGCGNNDPFLHVNEAIIKSPGLKSLADKVLEQPGLAKDLVNLCRHGLKSMDAYVDDPNRAKLQLEPLNELSQYFVGKPAVVNPHPVKHIPPHHRLKARFFEPSLYFRLQYGKKSDSSGSALAVVTQWIPDLEAVATINHYLNIHNIPLAPNFMHIREIVPLGSRRPVPVKTLSDWTHHVIQPAKKFRYPQTHNPSIKIMIDTMFAIDFEALKLTPHICENFNLFLNEVSKQELKTHLFVEPERTVENKEEWSLPEKLSAFRNRSCTIVENKQTGAEPFDSKLLLLLKDIKNSVLKLKPDDLQKTYSDMKRGSKKLVNSFKGLLVKSTKTSTRSPRKSDSTPKSSGTETSPIKIEPNRKLVMSAPGVPAFKDLVQRIPPLKDKLMEKHLLYALLESDFWHKQPKEAAWLCARIEKMHHKTDKEGTPTNDLIELFETAAKSKNGALVQSHLDSAKKGASTFTAKEQTDLLDWMNKLPDVRSALYEEYCHSEANAVIMSQNWHLLPKESRLKLSEAANVQHISQLIEGDLDNFFKQDVLSKNERKRLGLISLKIMSQLATFLEQEDSNPQAKELLRKLRVMHTQYSDTLNEKSEEADLEFSQTCQNWLHSICWYLYEQNSSHFYEVVREIESLFVTVWKKVEVQLKAD
ncbi:MAG: hypothetical protein H3C47_04790 [Candidatus Cloacimonetes bacterium]|nr:hypothetical protein [Candidatus Cloacimonadota bacterium]